MKTIKTLFPFFQPFNSWAQPGARWIGSAAGAVGDPCCDKQKPIECVVSSWRRVFLNLPLICAVLVCCGASVCSAQDLRGAYETVISGHIPKAWFKINCSSLVNEKTGSNLASNSGPFWVSDVFGNANSAYAFRNNADNLTMAPTSGNDAIGGGGGTFTKGSITMLFRALSFQANARRYLLSQGSGSSTDQIAVYLDGTSSSGDLTVEVGGTGGSGRREVILADSAIVRSAWYYLAVTCDEGRDGDEVRWYVGRIGGTLNSGSFGMASTTVKFGNQSDITVGNKEGASNGFRQPASPATDTYGAVDEVAFWQTELTDTQINQQFAALPQAPVNPPSGIFTLTNWNILLPVFALGSSGDALEIKTEELSSGYEFAPVGGCQKQHFFSGADGAMVFQAPYGGAPSAGQARSELRQTRPSGTTHEWTASSEGGTHILEGTCAVNSAGPTGHGKVIIGQIHSKSPHSRPAIVLFFDNNSSPPSIKLTVKETPTDPDPDQDYTLATSVQTNDIINYQLKMVGTGGGSPTMTLTATVKVNGGEPESEVVDMTQAPYDSAWTTETLYFKAGCYFPDDRDDVDGAAGHTAQVSFYNLTMSLAQPPEITTQPESQIVNAGSSATFSVDSGLGTYQWRKNGVNIPGETSSSYTISSCAAADAATYTVVVTSGDLSTTSNPGRLAVITTQPMHKFVNAGQSPTFTVVVTGTGPFNYQWHKDDVAISGATSQARTISSCVCSDAGIYKVVVSKSGYTSCTSQSRQLTIVTATPQSQYANAGAQSPSLCFNVTVCGLGSATYQWRKNSVDISGATTDSLCFSTVSSGDIATYTLRLMLSGASMYSASAPLAFYVAPAITLQPRSKQANPGNSVTFTVAATGTPTLTYQWKKNGTAISNGGGISGATSPSLTFASVTTGDAGTYTVVVDNGATGDVTSDGAVLTVIDEPAWAAAGDVGSTYNFGPIYTHLEQPDGKILIGGSFGIHRLLADGAPDPAWVQGIPTYAGTTLSIADAGSQIYVGGSFAWYDYDEENNPTTYYNTPLIVLNSDGSISSMAYTSDGGVYALTVQSDGYVLVGGSFTTFDGYSRRRITRWGDSSFHTANNGVDSTVRTILTDSDGKILVGGTFVNFDDNNYSGWGTPHLLRLNSDGSLNDTFTSAYPGYAAFPSGVYSLALQSDDKILVGGNVANPWGPAGVGIMRLNSTGSGDSTFNVGVGANGTVHSIVAAPSGKVYVAGAFTAFDTITRRCIAGLNSDGSVDANINPGSGIGNGFSSTAPEIYSMSRSADGTFIVSGNFISYNGVTRYGIARLGTPPWTLTGNLNGARIQHTATLLPNGKVLVVSGLGDETYADAQLYNPLAGTWSAAATPGIARQSHSATLLPDGRVLVAGGLGPEAELYDPSTDSWTQTGDMNKTRTEHTAILLADGRVLVAAGSEWPGTAEIYDPSTETWTSTDPLTQNRIGHTMTLLNDGRVLITGGYDGTQISANAEVFDPGTGLWTAVSPMTHAKYYHTATLLADGRVLLVGGTAPEIYDPTTDDWSSTTTTPQLRMFHTATLLGNGKVLIAGGENTSHVPYTVIDIYDPATATWSVGPSLNTGRRSHTATLLQSRKVLVAGGDDGDDLKYNSVELLTP